MPNNVAALYNLLVVSISSLLGVGSPLGWLCTKIIFGAPIFVGSANISFGSIIAEFVPPYDTSIILISTFFVFKTSTFTFSLFSYFISFINKFATDADDLICTLLAFSGFEILFAISHTALIWIALTIPIPLIFVSSSSEISCKNWIFSLFLLSIDKISCASCTDVFSFVPVFIIIANNSEFDKLSIPYICAFSYGLSVDGNFFIININPFHHYFSIKLIMLFYIWKLKLLRQLCLQCLF